MCCSIWGHLHPCLANVVSRFSDASWAGHCCCRTPPIAGTSSLPKWARFKQDGNVTNSILCREQTPIKENSKHIGMIPADQVIRLRCIERGKAMGNHICNAHSTLLQILEK